MSAVSLKATLKFVIVGNSATGKTSILKRYFEDGFNHNTLSTIGIDFKIKRIRVANPTGTGSTEYRIQIWDTAGLESSRCLSSNFYRNSSGIVLVYDVSDRSSFSAIDRWMREIRDNCDQKTTVYLVGNKTDKRSLPSTIDHREVVTTPELEKLAEVYNCSYYECSAKDDVGVTKIFEDLIAQTIVERGITSPQSDLKSVATASVMTLTLKPEHKHEAKVSSSNGCCK